MCTGLRRGVLMRISLLFRRKTDSDDNKLNVLSEVNGQGDSEHLMKVLAVGTQTYQLTNGNWICWHRDIIRRDMIICSEQFYTLS